MLFDESKTNKFYKNLILQCNLIRDEIWITAFNLNKLQVGHVKFVRSGDHIFSASVVVDWDYRKQGIATAMYVFAHEMGYKIRPSEIQSTDGQNMWKAFRKKKLPFTAETFLERLTRQYKEVIVSIGF